MSKANLLFKRMVVLGVVVVCIAWLSAPASAQGGCASANTSVYPYTAHPGQAVAIASFIPNCSGGKARYIVEHIHTDACGVRRTLSSIRLTFAAGQTRFVSVSYIVPPDACLGAGSETVNVYGGSLLASASAPLTVAW